MLILFAEPDQYTRRLVMDSTHEPDLVAKSHKIAQLMQIASAHSTRALSSFSKLKRK
jgi:hypothetical protein